MTHAEAMEYLRASGQMQEAMLAIFREEERQGIAALLRADGVDEQRAKGAVLFIQERVLRAIEKMQREGIAEAKAADRAAKEQPGGRPVALHDGAGY